MAGTKGKSGGHNRKPTRHRQLVGEQHKARTMLPEPDKVDGKVLPMVKLDDHAQRFFDYYAPMLENNGTMSMADAFAFTMLCKKAADWIAVSKKTEDICLTSCDNKGNEKIAPLIRLEMYLFDQVTKMLREFGLTPVARSAVTKIGNGEKRLPFAGTTG